MNCALCGLPTPATPVSDAGRAYCCIGCREVARLLGAAPDQSTAAPASAGSAAPAHGEETYFWVDDMHCASCERLIAHVASRVDGVLAVHASYATGTAKVVYDPARVDEADLPARLSVAGYRFRPRGEAAAEYDERADLLRMLAGGCLASAVMMLSFVFIYPLHAGWIDAADYAAIAWLAFGLAPAALFVLTSVQVFVVGWPILRGALAGLRARALNMDALLAVAIVAAYGYSVFQLRHDPVDLYFDVASGVVAVITIGRFLERGARAAALRELAKVMNAPAPLACVVRAGECFNCTADTVRPGDRVFVRQSETIPVDGTIVDGAGAVDESLLTGEPFPKARQRGDQVLGGAVLREGRIEIDVGTKVQSRISELARILWQAQASSSRAQGRADQIARAFVPVVLALALLVGLGFLAAGASPQRSMLAALATLIVSCPCTFGLAIPLTIASATSAALRRGILVIRPDLFDQGARIDIVAIDKTGTLSTGEMSVTGVFGPAETVPLAAAVERDSPHPVARAIAQLDRSAVARDVEFQPGRGGCGSVGRRRVAVGSQALFDGLRWPVPAALAAAAARADSAGVVSYVGWDGTVQGAIVTEDRPRPQWESVVKQLRERGALCLLTGAASAGDYALLADEVFAGVPPEAKAAVVRHLRTRGRVAMIGDGSNDAPALAQADVAIAFGAPTALAAQAAAIVITGDRLERVVDALEIVDTTRKRIRQNLGWALSYNALAVPLAMIGQINPLWAALAMTASSLLVVWNATRPILRGPDLADGDCPAPDKGWAV